MEAELDPGLRVRDKRRPAHSLQALDMCFCEKSPAGVGQRLPVPSPHGCLQQLLRLAKPTAMQLTQASGDFFLEARGVNTPAIHLKGIGGGPADIAGQQHRRRDPIVWSPSVREAAPKMRN